MKVIEIFESIDGEVNHWGQGTQSTFVRFAGCNLLCEYCDTPKSQYSKEGKEIIPMLIVDKIKTKKVTLTGGEPFLQSLDCLKYLIKMLTQKNKLISIETNGTIDIPNFCYVSNCSLIIDFKLDQWKKDNIKINFKKLREIDWIKFPITNFKYDYYTAVNLAEIFNDYCKARIAFSPIGIPAKKLLKKLQQQNLDFIVLNTQLHKLLKLK